MEKKVLLNISGEDSKAAVEVVRKDPFKALEMIKESGLKGRSGSCFPTGPKLESTAKCGTGKKYVICNADEGEPGTFKDRVLISSVPEALVAGVIIAGIITGADEGFIYLRGEYAGLKEKLENAILGQGYDFSIKIFVGCGSYICGEETGLLESVEGRRPEPRMKPPYPSFEGLFGKPTVISNVETLVNLTYIVLNGAAGTKLMCLSGCVANPGIYECELGTTIAEMYEIAGGCPQGKTLRCMQVGGGSCAVVGLEAMETQYSGGTGSVLFIGDDCDLVGLCRCASSFFSEESCGRCNPCRLGNKKIVKILDEFMADRGTEAGLLQLEEIARFIKNGAACPFGAASVTPLLSVIENFSEDFRKHMKD